MLVIDRYAAKQSMLYEVARQSRARCAAGEFIRFLRNCGVSPRWTLAQVHKKSPQDFWTPQVLDSKNHFP